MKIRARKSMTKAQYDAWFSCYQAWYDQQRFKKKRKECKTYVHHHHYDDDEDIEYELLSFELLRSKT